MTVQLPPMPDRIASLKRDNRGYPIPRFVDRGADKNGEPDFRYADFAFRTRAYKTELCWVCGQKLGRHRVFAIGPMCVVNRTTMEPPAHRECATWSVKACPFLSRPKMRRNDKMPEEVFVPGTMIARNPGCVCLYEGDGYKAFDAGNGWLIRLGEPVRVEWWAEGREATRAEVFASIDSGYPLLLAEARKDGSEAIAELADLLARAMTLMPAA
jgi:hypothetical protein